MKVAVAMMVWLSLMMRRAKTEQCDKVGSGVQVEKSDCFGSEPDQESLIVGKKYCCHFEVEYKDKTRSMCLAYYKDKEKIDSYIAGLEKSSSVKKIRFDCGSLYSKVNSLRNIIGLLVILFI